MAQAYARGVPVAPLERGEATRRPGPRRRSGRTTTIFETTDCSFETLSRRMQETAFLNRGLRISLTDERPPIVDDAEDDALRRRRGRRRQPRSVIYKYAGGSPTSSGT